MTHEIAFVGTGENPDDPGRDGYAMAYRHADAFERLDDCELVACTDVVPENARAFADHFDIPDAAVYENHETMLAEYEPSILSVCVPPGVHADIVVSAAETDVPDAIHCEKPVATAWGDCRRMARVCDERGVQLTINHQLRYSGPFRRAKALYDDGAIGDLRRVEFSAENLYDTGTHMFDMSGFVTGQEPVEWVLAGLDYRDENRWFGEHNENQAVAQWRYESGAYGLASVGGSADMIDAKFRLLGTAGAIEVGAEGGLPLRLRRGDGWETVDTDGEGVYGPKKTRTSAALGKVLDVVPGVGSDLIRDPEPLDRAVAAVVESLETGRQPELAVENVLQTTELAFAAWESVRQRGRVDLPLAVSDNPLAAMVEDGSLPVGEETRPTAER
jgi:predicted dehydrogenase